MSTLVGASEAAAFSFPPGCFLRRGRSETEGRRRRRGAGGEERQVPPPPAAMHATRRFAGRTSDSFVILGQCGTEAPFAPRKRRSFPPGTSLLSVLPLCPRTGSVSDTVPAAPRPASQPGGTSRTRKASVGSFLLGFRSLSLHRDLFKPRKSPRVLSV